MESLRGGGGPYGSLSLDMGVRLIGPDGADLFGGGPPLRTGGPLFSEGGPLDDIPLKKGSELPES